MHSELVGKPIPAKNWLPTGKTAAVVFSIDDIFPGRDGDPYEAGGGLASGVLGRLGYLLNKHAKLRPLLFVTPDWRLRSPQPNWLRRWLKSLPGFRERLYCASVLGADSFRLDRHPEFCRYLKTAGRWEIGVHGYQHISSGKALAREFDDLSMARCSERIQQAIEIFNAASISYQRGFAPPAWSLSSPLAYSLVENGFRFVCSARDLETPVSEGALNGGDGIKGVSLIHPNMLCEQQLVHITTNFQATSTIDRAFSICDAGGVLSVKAHAFKHAFRHIQLDGLDRLYTNYLDIVFAALAARYGERLWWTTHREITERVMSNQACKPLSTQEHTRQISAAA